MNGDKYVIIYHKYIYCMVFDLKRGGDVDNDKDFVTTHEGNE